MKRIFTILVSVTLIAVFLPWQTNAQAPQKMTYQAVVRDANSQLITNTQVGIQIRISQGSVTGTQVYSETQTPTTNANGLLTIEIGGQTFFDTITWVNGPYFLETNIDPKGGTNYTITGTSQLLSVPYALHAKTAESITDGINETDPVFTSWDKSSGISITENQISDLDHFTNTDETDPVFGSSAASGITGTDTTNWNNKSEFSGDYNDLTNLPEGTAPGEIRYWNGSEWANIIPGVDEQILMFIGEIPQWTTYQPGIATVITDSVYNINGNTAFVDANVSSEGGNFVSERGILWNENPDLNINEDNKIIRGSSSGTYTTEINSLSLSTIYYTRAYAINSAGTDYGDELSFNTTNGLPILVISDITDITDFSATSGGTITDNNGFAITARGVCWSVLQNPTISDIHTTDGTGSGSFVSSITGLLDATTYYVRAYATNSIGTGYSNEQSFVTTNGCIDYDGNIYQTVIIGNQKWMAENLKVTHYPNGDEIPLVTDNTAWGNLDYINTDDAYCYYNNNSSNEKDTYGALYTYAAAIGDNWARDNIANQGVCPDGWHLPNDLDWTELTDYLGGESVTGGKLKEIGITHWNSPNTGATNETGFTALPGGSRHWDDGIFNNLGYDGHWWSSDGLYNDRGLYYNHDNIVLDGYEKSHGFSVRCVRDK